ncbi:hypothetical protein BGZ73_006899 [Actinomortierella ambigua]|nr:hypothetical protein BGZ73_006899 [Actinomortierella ambigua]
MEHKHHDFDTSAKIHLVLGLLSADPQLCLPLKITLNRREDTDASLPIGSVYHRSINNYLLQWITSKRHILLDVLLFFLSIQRGCRRSTVILHAALDKNVRTGLLAVPAWQSRCPTRSIIPRTSPDLHPSIPNFILCLSIISTASPTFSSTIKTTATTVSAML